MDDTLGDDPRLADGFRRIRERIDLNDRYAGLDVEAESTIRALRDGVPPPRVSGISVGRATTTADLAERLRGAAAMQRPSPTVLDVGDSDGLSHLMRWTSERAAGLGFGVAALDEMPTWSDPRSVQEAVLGALRVDGRTLIEGLAEGTLRSDVGATRHARALATELSPGGTAALTSLLEAVAHRRLDAALAIVDWLLGAPSDAAWRRSHGLPSSPNLAPTARGVVAAAVYLSRAFGAHGVLITIDSRADGGSRVPAVAELGGVPFSLVLSGSRVERGHSRELTVPHMTPAELRRLARLIRDYHVKAFAWPDAGRVADDELERLLPAAKSEAPVRDWVRTVTAQLDLLLANQSPR